MGQTGTSELVGTSVAVEGNGTAALTEASIAAGRLARAHKKFRVSLALIDPKPLTRQSILEMLAKLLPEYEMVATSSCEELLQVRGTSSGCPNLVVIHVRTMGIAHAWVQNTLALVRRRLADAPVAVLSDRDDVDDVREALACGVRGYIPTTVESGVASAALRLIIAGGTFIPANALHSANGARVPGSEGEPRGIPDKLDLTPREFAVIDLLKDGTPNKVIATQLKMQESTVKVHVRNIMKKLHVANRTHAASVANRLLGQRAPTTVALAPPATDAGSSLLPAQANGEDG